MAVEHRIAVAAADHSYPVIIRPGLLADAGSQVRSVSRADKAVIVSNEQVGPLYREPLSASLRSAGFQPIHVTLPGGEARKTLADLLPAFDVVLNAKVERSTPVIALGGGIIGDMAGFLAASCLRGMPLVQMPTTLLAAVDASVGGKTGVNHAAGKNLIGAFHQPIAVLIDPELLRSLPPREFRAGLAECIKHDIIRDAAGFAQLEQTMATLSPTAAEPLAGLIAHNVRIKAAIVAADPFEHGERAHLNLGHTFGHAIETVTHYTLNHGESVALGLCAAAYLATDVQGLGDADRCRIVALVAAAGLPTHAASLDVDAVLAAMAFDKKVRDGKLRFVLPVGIGKAVIRDDVPIDLARSAVMSLLGG